MTKNRLLIFGGLGQDGSLLTDLLHESHDIICVTKENTDIQKKIEQHPYLARTVRQAKIYKSDIASLDNVKEIIQQINPDLICNFAAYSNVFSPWSCPKDVLQTNAVIPSIILQSMLETSSKAKFVQASSSLVFGAGNEVSCDENSPRNPILPYGIAKNTADSLIKEARNVMGLNACSAILFNHESERRNIQFFTRKVVLAARQISKNKEIKLTLGDIDIVRDIGHARDFVKAVSLMLEEKNPEDYVLGTGAFTTMREFVSETFSFYGLNYKEHVIIDPSLIRKIDTLPKKANSQKAKDRLTWSAKPLSANRLIEDELQGT